jgi:hypothetical protein
MKIFTLRVCIILIITSQLNAAFREGGLRETLVSWFARHGNSVDGLRTRKPQHSRICPEISNELRYMPQWISKTKLVWRSLQKKRLPIPGLDGR